MHKSEFYCGLPQDQWDNLLVKAEDLLRDEDLGSHLVGIYPAGNRIYGIESEPHGVICLYVDSVESLIDPSTPKRKTGFHEFKIGYSNSPIVMIDLFYWARWLINMSFGWQLKYFPHAIPLSHDFIYQDDSIISILEAAQELMEAKRFTTNKIPEDSFDTEYIKLFYNRAMAILASTGKFYPCLNPDWGKVYNIDNLITNEPEIISKLDKKLTKLVMSNFTKSILSNEEIIVLNNWYETQAFQKMKKISIRENSAKKLGKEVANLYRFQL